MRRTLLAFMIGIIVSIGTTVLTPVHGDKVAEKVPGEPSVRIGYI